MAPGEKMTPQELNRHGFPMGTHEGERLVAREVGEAMFRKYGVSGIAAFNLSRLAEPGDVLAVDFVPWVRLCDMEAFLNRRRQAAARLARARCDVERYAARHGARARGRRAAGGGGRWTVRALWPKGRRPS